MSDFAPFELGKHCRPPYYLPTHPGKIPADCDPFDIADAFDLGRYETMALKYILRAGRKPGAERRHDLTKALEILQRALGHEAFPRRRPEEELYTPEELEKRRAISNRTPPPPV